MSNPTILMGNSTPGEVNGSALDKILTAFDQDSFTNLNSVYAEPVLGVQTGPGGAGITVKGTDSLFNPFYVFRYAKFADIQGQTYSSDLHRDDTPSILENISNFVLGEAKTASPIKQYNNEKKTIQNPTAGQIIQWAQNNADQNLNNTTLGPIPYQWNDFLWCKYYGKIPNNRLLTLRRYPIPVEDNLQIAQEKMPLIPIAQAVTWWGEETGNSLSSILGITYGFKWEPLTTKVQDVVGNEVKAEDLLNATGIESENLKKLLLYTLFDNPNNPYAATGYDDTLQEWIENAWSQEGQYWNRVLGPVNVIDTTQMRKRGYDFTHDISLKFTYKLRSFNNINPKIAMLDLISNFLSLTHNKAEFWGGGIRYFQKTGFTLPGLKTDKFDKGDFIGGIKDIIEQLAVQVQGKAGELGALAGDIGKDITEADLGAIVDSLEQTDLAQNLAGSWVKNLLQAPLKMRSFLDGRAVGEWHLTVGNPMSPIAVIGNLCLKNTTISFSDSVGLDDFPTEVSFTVTLMHGRDRAKQDIESMFNLGGGDMYFSPLPQPSSAYNSFGERNSAQLNNSRSQTETDGTATGESSNAELAAPSGALVAQSADPSIPGQPRSVLEAENLANYFRTNVRRAYGSKFAQSQILTDYFLDLKTKD